MTSTLEWPGARVRSTFISYLESKQHTFVPSSSVVPHEDPTLLFANAGMNQFKPIFLGNVTPGSEMASWKRTCNSQKCIRAGGKHNDLDDVGKDVYHHTFFEMLGNWSFGDYFKVEAIDYAWELLTQVYKLNPDRLYATYFGGSAEMGLPADEEARDLWLRYLPASRILPYGPKENFWEMGETGPCGPCSEIHFDRIGGRDASALVNQDDPNVLEIWNLVFMQFDRQPDRSLRSLPNKHVDTGMGLERVTSVLQGKMSNYDTDLFTYLFDAIQQETKARPYGGKLGPEDVDRVDFTYRVIADHVRTLTFAVNDGAAIGNEGREYVLRRILRRAVRYGREFLKAPLGFFSRLSSKVVEHMADAFPELKKNPKRIYSILEAEERAFSRTLDKGIQRFLKIAEGAKEISGDAAFMLYDTYGFPLDLTQIMADERNLSVDIAGYEKSMQQQKERSRAKKSAAGAVSLELRAEQTDALSTKMAIEPTDDSSKYDWKSIGEGNDVTATVKAIWDGKNWIEKATTETPTVGIVVDKTNFYAESGGQIFDTGAIFSDAGKFEVEDSQKYGSHVLHIGQCTNGSISVGDSVSVSPDYVRRAQIACNHTGTHALNLGLRQVLGEGVDQKGSLVAGEKLRFDFSWSGPVSAEQCGAVEKIVSDLIATNPTVYKQTCDLSQARRICSLRAVFGEVYPDPVRVVSIGKPIDPMLSNPDCDEWKNLSVEFCGGTHVDNFGEASAFAIVSEEGISKGVRRIVAVTGQEAAAAINAAQGFEDRLANTESLTPPQLDKLLSTVAGEMNTVQMPVSRAEALRKKIHSLRDRVVAAAKADAAEKAEKAKQWAQSKVGETAEGEVIVSLVDVGGAIKALGEAAKPFTERNPVLLLSADDAGGYGALAIVPKAQTAKLDAKEWVQLLLDKTGGKGGGKNDRAQGTGQNAGQLASLVAEAEAFAKAKLA